MWEYNGYTFEGDIADADFSDRFEEVMTKIRDTDRAVVEDAKNLTSGEVIRRQCRVVDEALDALFGDGTAKKIFGGRMNMLDHLEALDNLAQWAMARKKQINDTANRYTQRYQNRAQRRANKKR